MQHGRPVDNFNHPRNAVTRKVTKQQKKATFLPLTSASENTHCSRCCCDNCDCVCRFHRSQHTSLPIRTNAAAESSRPGASPALAVNAIGRNMASFSTDASSRPTSMMEMGSSASRSLFVACSLEALSQSPAHRSDDVIKHERKLDFMRDVDDLAGRRLLYDPVDAEDAMDDIPVFGNLDMTDSMLVRRSSSDLSQAMLGSYTSMFNSGGSSGTLAGVGQGL